MITTPTFLQICFRLAFAEYLSGTFHGSGSGGVVLVICCCLLLVSIFISGALFSNYPGSRIVHSRLGLRLALFISSGVAVLSSFFPGYKHTPPSSSPSFLHVSLIPILILVFPSTCLFNVVVFLSCTCTSSVLCCCNINNVCDFDSNVTVFLKAWVYRGIIDPGFFTPERLIEEWVHVGCYRSSSSPPRWTRLDTPDVPCPRTTMSPLPNTPSFTTKIRRKYDFYSYVVGDVVVTSCSAHTRATNNAWNHSKKTAPRDLKNL